MSFVYLHNTLRTLIDLGFFYSALTCSILLQVFDMIEQRVKPIITILSFLLIGASWNRSLCRYCYKKRNHVDMAHTFLV